MLFYKVDHPDFVVPILARCMEYLNNMKDFAPGQSVELEDGVRCVMSAYDTVEESQALWEAHRRYVDVHCVIDGEERVSVCDLAQAQVGTYHAERDYLETKGIPAVDLLATAGTVLCLFPNDVHRTRVQTGPDRSNRMTKVIFKVPVALFE